MTKNKKHTAGEMFAPDAETLRKAKAKRVITETVTDVHSAIASLPPRYFNRKVDKARSSLCETVSGMRTLIGQVRMKKSSKQGRRLPAWALLAVGALAAAALAALLLLRHSSPELPGVPAQATAQAK